MKTGILPVAIMVVLMTVAGCADKKVTKDQSELPALEVTGGEYQKMVPGMEDGDELMTLFIPISSSSAEAVIDSVFFMGRKAAMHGKAAEGEVVYKATFNLTAGVPQAPPTRLEEQEALVVWRYQNKRHLKHVTGIAEKEAIYAP